MSEYDNYLIWEKYADECVNESEIVQDFEQQEYDIGGDGSLYLRRDDLMLIDIFKSYKEWSVENE